MKARLVISAQLGNFHHLLQLLCLPRDHVEEGELVKVLDTLERGLDHGLIALLERDACELRPALFFIHGLGRFHCNVKVAAFKSQVKASFVLTDELERDLVRSVVRSTHLMDNISTHARPTSG